MKLATCVLLLMPTASCMISQIVIDTSERNFRQRYVVSPANGDPNARTFEEINQVNLRLAASGNTDADFQLGLAYMQGIGVTQDFDKAEHYFEVGAMKPSDKALVSNFYLEHGWFPFSPEKAVHWLLAAGRSGDLFEAAQVYRRFNPPQQVKAVEIYRELLKRPETAEFRRAQMELGNLVLDGKYDPGANVAARKEGLEWARIITQELLGQQEYTIAVAYHASVDGVPKSQAMWLRFCKRAAAYNIDLAQQLYGQAILQREIKNASPFEGYAWIRLASSKQYSNKAIVQRLDAQMTPEELLKANSAFIDLVTTRERYGAYYSPDDSLRDPASDALKGMPDDDPDVQIRRAFALESSSKPEDYQKALTLYRIARDRRGMDVKVVLGRDYLYGTNGVAKDATLAKYWLNSAAESGSKPAALYLARWYRGEGGGTSDDARAYAWEWLGTETSVKPDPSHLTSAQNEAAQVQITDWKASHAGW